ncbi:MAG: hypothetical protein H6595_11290 [Flavobacteriales bacterium]|nr:hypothetical protein [Flavobacteriales bacterium]MCB9168044.1 hypothetical protein [Flavobacteriales bacterium]
MSTHWTILIAGVLLGSCYKSPIVPDELRNNPFDPDYDGPAVFTLEDHHVDVVINGADTNRVLRCEVRVHEEYFLNPTTYVVHYALQGDTLAGTVQSFAIADEVFTTSIQRVTIGQEYCIDLRLGNTGSFASPVALCAIAEY